MEPLYSVTSVWFVCFITPWHFCVIVEPKRQASRSEPWSRVRNSCSEGGSERRQPAHAATAADVIRGFHNLDAAFQVSLPHFIERKGRGPSRKQRQNASPRPKPAAQQISHLRDAVLANKNRTASSGGRTRDTMMFSHTHNRSSSVGDSPTFCFTTFNLIRLKRMNQKPSSLPPSTTTTRWFLTNYDG